ncbi:hypothetical protein BOX15_Mlig010458g1 [Macrostomum lignano]|uniref:MRH domain-containing protein n=1 Tax=Macrostomum lignano TaxID=282301 RepID=A0A267H8K6_9PLAT|nr:hypothetical protein BOX15_Mlig010458g1 [Macrostomum lignano]
MIKFVLCTTVMVVNFVLHCITSSAFAMLPMQLHNELAAANHQVPIKVLDSPHNYFQQQQQQQQQQRPQQPKKPVTAKPPSGPARLISGLFGRCYSTQVGAQYEYTLCPFDNATQRDVVYRALDGFHGVIGVWDGWLVDHSGANESRLVAMAMPNGVPCGHGRDSRRTLVELACSRATRLASVVESPVCQYKMLLETPLACQSVTGSKSMQVYPSLTERQRSVWDALYTMRHRGLLNASSYELLLDNLIFRVGLLSDTRKFPNQVKSSATPAYSTESHHQNWPHWWNK